jgi:hypothetical protein
MEAVRYSDTVATDVASDGPVRLLDLSRGPVASPSPQKNDATRRVCSTAVGGTRTWQPGVE